MRRTILAAPLDAAAVVVAGAGEDPPFAAMQFRSWLEAGHFEARIKYSTYLPPTSSS